MAINHIEFYSEQLGMKTRINVILPEHPTQTGHVLILLHGLGDDENTWLEQTKIAAYVNQSQITVIMPRVDRSYYTSQPGGPKYFEYISQEILQRYQQWFNLIPEKKRTFIAGVSMGGFGALKIGLMYPEKFGHIFLMSAMPDIIANWQENPERDIWFRSIFGSPKEVKNSINDIKYLLTQQSHLAPKIWQLCGRDDAFYNMNQSLAKQIERQGMSHEFKIVKGGHEWSVWDKAIREVLDIISEKI